MTENIVIVGAGGLGREVRWLIERINNANMRESGNSRWKLLGFVDDDLLAKKNVGEITFLGNTDWLLGSEEHVAVVCAIANVRARKKIIDKLQVNRNLYFPNLVEPMVPLSSSISMGIGNIICIGNILTVDIRINDFTILNFGCTVGHDAEINSYVTVYPGANLSGNIKIGQETEIGTGCQIIQGIKVGSQTIVGAGAVVIRDLPDRCTAVGNPAKIIKYLS